MNEPSPTLDLARALGFRTLAVVCPSCGAEFGVPLSAIDLPGDTPLAKLGAARPLACVNCSGAGEISLQAMGFNR